MREGVHSGPDADTAMADPAVVPVAPTAGADKPAVVPPPTTDPAAPSTEPPSAGGGVEMETDAEAAQRLKTEGNGHLKAGRFARPRPRMPASAGGYWAAALSPLATHSVTRRGGWRATVASRCHQTQHWDTIDCMDGRTLLFCRCPLPHWTFLPPVRASRRAVRRGRVEV